VVRRLARGTAPSSRGRSPDSRIGAPPSLPGTDGPSGVLRARSPVTVARPCRTRTGFTFQRGRSPAGSRLGLFLMSKGFSRIRSERASPRRNRTRPYPYSGTLQATCPLPALSRGARMTLMATPADRVPKALRLRLHRLKNAYRKAYRREPPFELPVTEETAAQAIAFLEEALRQVGMTVQDESANKSAIRGKRTRRPSRPGSTARGG
jgi:hypothetical protein